MIAQIIMGIMVIVVAIGVLNFMSVETTNALNQSADTNVSLPQYATQMISLAPIVYSIIGVFIVLAIVLNFISSYRNYTSQEDYIEEEEQGIPHKQTYLDYVKERLSVERLMGK